MKSICLFILCFASANASVFSQSSTSTKIYFYSAPSRSLTTTLNLDTPIKIGKCTLLETNADSLGINILKNKIVYLHFEQGHTYYYKSIGGDQYTYATVSSCAETDFWLNIHFAGPGTYRHYFLDKKSGLKLLEETR